MAAPRASSYDGFTIPTFPVFHDSGIFDHVAAQWGTPPALPVSTDGPPVRTSVGFATFDFFDMLGVGIPLGRGFAAEDDRRGAPPVAILTDAYWRRAFDGRGDAVGRTITVKGKAVTIVGVSQPGFLGLDLSRAVDLYLPFHTIGDVDAGLTNHFAEAGHPSSPTSGTQIVARLRIDTSAEQALARVTALDPAGAGRGTRPVYALTPINRAAIPVRARAGMAQFARLLGTTVAFLLFIGCGTVGMLLLIRTEARREELALCVALGASRGRLARGIALEGALLSGAGAAAAVPIASWLFKGIAAFQLPGGIDIGLLRLGVDGRALAAAAAAAVLASVAIAVIAATFGLTADAAESLRSRGGATPRTTRRRTRAALVMAQVAVAMVLVAGAGLFARSLTAALNLNAGVDMGRVITGEIQLRPYGYDAQRSTAFFEDLKTRLQANASIASVGSTQFQSGMGGKVTVDGVPRQFPSMLWFIPVDDGYLSTMRVRLKGGRDFSDADRRGAPRVALASESLARQLAGGGNPIGRRITLPFSRMGEPADVIEVVGVVEDVVERVSVLEPLNLYLPARQSDPVVGGMLVVRAAGDADAARREIISAIKAADPSVAPSPFLTLEERIGSQMARAALRHGGARYARGHRRAPDGARRLCPRGIDGRHAHARDGHPRRAGRHPATARRHRHRGNGTAGGVRPRGGPRTRVAGREHGSRLPLSDHPAGSADARRGRVADSHAGVDRQCASRIEGRARRSRQRAQRAVIIRGASPLGLPDTLSRAPLRRRAPFAWAHSLPLVRAARRGYFGPAKSPFDSSGLTRISSSFRSSRTPPRPVVTM